MKSILTKFADCSSSDRKGYLEFYTVQQSKAQLAKEGSSIDFDTNILVRYLRKDDEQIFLFQVLCTDYDLT